MRVLSRNSVATLSERSPTVFPSLAISPASWLANRVQAHYSALGRSGLTQLKLQKLCFYAAGVAWGHGAGAELSELAFEAWRHGPVLREIYYPAGAVPTARDVEPFSVETEGHVADAVTVYGLISPWGLREQSHLEQPWIDANALDRPGCPGKFGHIEASAHFRTKFADGAVCLPEHMVDSGVFAVDGLRFAPVFPTFHALADYVRSGLVAPPCA